MIVPFYAKPYPIWDHCREISDLVAPTGLFGAILAGESREYLFFANSVRTLLVAYLALLLAPLRRARATIVFCVYNPWEFADKGAWASIYRRLVLSLRPENLFFMNGSCYREHEAVCPVGTIGPRFLPLSMPAVSSSRTTPFDPDRKTVLSVGRFVGFKLHYMRALLRYAQERPQVAFYLVGYGEGESELKGFASEHGLQNVHFLGMVPYADLQELYRQADCYVGMGTTLVEASSVGTPAVVAIAGVSGDLCNGLFVDQTEYDMGEFCPDKPKRPLTACLDEVLDLGEDDYAALCERHREFARQFERARVGETFIQLCEAARPTTVGLRSVGVFLGFCLATVLYYATWRLRGGKSRYDEEVRAAA